MRKGIILNLKHFKVINYVNHNKIFILLCLSFVVGIVIGCCTYSDNTVLADFSEKIFLKYISVHIGNSFFKKFFLIFTKFAFVLILHFLFGTSVFGIVSIPFLTAWQGILFGNISSYLYSGYALRGIAFNAIVFVPPLIIFTISSFFAAKNAITFSFRIVKLTLPKNRPLNLYTDFKNYCGRFLVFLIFSILSAIVDIVLNLLFLHFFEF